ncbi:MAG: hypothetical protein A2284_01190 [Deltaproteobacteria bacterium RIFOXYA12_FULL_61_11]|nr:MAG: hypothetical protein A2284_01190 [Deltaproteobacteria bacterium RIFOXYA12_FULL_61_11]
MTCWLILVGLLGAHPGGAAPPRGQSALLNGMHDLGAFEWLQRATPGNDKGWLTDLQYLGGAGTFGGNCHREVTNAGVAIIMRLDFAGDSAVPRSSAEVAGYAGGFAAFVAACDNLAVFIVGNEPNVGAGKSDPDCTSPLYAETYAAVHRAVHALPGGDHVVLLVAPNSPYSPGCLHSLRSIVAGIQAAGITPDGFALHAYTRSSRGDEVDSALPASSQTQRDTTIDECPGGAVWEDTWHGQFRIYKDYIRVLEEAGLSGRPVYVTESGNACDVSAGNRCYPNDDRGYFQALYAEADQHNRQAATKIRAITPYRWTGFDDGTGRDFEIGSKPGLLADLEAAFAQRYTWLENDHLDPVPADPASSPSPCSDDLLCPAEQEPPGEGKSPEGTDETPLPPPPAPIQPQGSEDDQISVLGCSLGAAPRRGTAAGILSVLLLLAWERRRRRATFRPGCSADSPCPRVEPGRYRR